MNSNLFVFIKSKNTVLFKKKITEKYDGTIKERNTIHEVVILIFLNKKHTRGNGAMALHSSTLAWKIPWAEEPSGLQSMGSLRVGRD